MSQVIWKKHLAPDSAVSAEIWLDENFHASVENVKRYPVASADIAIPDPRAFRAMSRASVMLSHVCTEARLHFAEQVAMDPFSVGVYCAVENGPIDAPSTAKILAAASDDFVQSYRKCRNPKMYLKQLPNVAPAQMGIFFGLQGPMNVYTHSRMAGWHALDQAEQDLNSGLVEMALVCTAHAFDDFIVVKRTSQQDSRTLTEGAAGILLGRSSARESKNWESVIHNDPKHYFGIGDPIINLARGRI